MERSALFRVLGDVDGALPGAARASLVAEGRIGATEQLIEIRLLDASSPSYDSAFVDLAQ